MKKEKAIEQNRAALKQLLLNKSALKQDIADDCEKVFESFKKMIQFEIDALKKVIDDPRIRLYTEDKGKFEMHVYIGSDVLVFNLHNNVFRLPDNNPLWGTSYFRGNENNGYFGIINVYNFLAESFLKNRIEDIGYLIGRVFVNHERHFWVEGKGMLGGMFRDPQNLQLSDDIVEIIVQLAFAHALEFDLYIPPFEYYDQLTVSQIQYIGDSLKLQTAKRLGFRMKGEEN
jgi:hypothetical protein